MLGIYRPRLYSKIKKHKIGREPINQSESNEQGDPDSAS